MSNLFPGSEKIVQGQTQRQTLLLAGPPGCGKTTFLQQFVYDRLQEGIPCLYITTDSSPNMVVENMVYLGLDVTNYVKNGLLRFVDCYSRRASSVSSGPYVVENPENLTDLSMVIDEAIRGLDRACFALDSITTLALNTRLDSTRKFLSIFLAEEKQLGCFGMATVDLGVLEDTFVNFLRLSFDGVLEIKMEETEKGELFRLLRVFSMRMAKYTTSWVKLEMGEKGILISS